jgi:hypothetical protein
MVIEAGKYYRTRSGSVAYVAGARCPFQKIEHGSFIIGWIENKQYGAECLSWEQDGSFSSNRGHTALDLVEETEAPISQAQRHMEEGP